MFSFTFTVIDVTVAFILITVNVMIGRWTAARHYRSPTIPCLLYTSSTRNVDLVRSIGASEVIDYSRSDFARQPRRYDVVVDTIGNRTLRDLRRAVKPRGTLVVAGGGGGKWFRPMALALKTVVVAPFVRQQLRGVMSAVTKENLETCLLYTSPRSSEEASRLQDRPSGA